MLVEEQISARQARGQSAILKVLAEPESAAYGDYEVQAHSGRKYRVAMRGPGLFENFCSCPDFAVNTLGTCKHIEALLQRLRKRFGRGLTRQKYHRKRASLSLHYGETLGVRLRLPEECSRDLSETASKHFDSDGFLRKERLPQFNEMLEHLRRLDETTVIYSDVLEFIEHENELAEGLEKERLLLNELAGGRAPLADVLKAPLFPYQVQGALFAACRGRVVLADDMGLGKTIQALAATELLRRWRGIARVLIVAPASVKYQWKTEIEKFSGLPAQVIDGPLHHRKKLYASPSFFNLTSYEVVLRDIEEMQRLQPDLIILDEAQRIRNWATATARTVKQLKSRYAFVLTGTPLENKLEELYSVVEFVDGRRLGPVFRFLKEHRMEDGKGKLLGYRGLDLIHRQLEPILLRRTRKEVLTQLPPRTDQVFRVRMTPQQSAPYWEQNDILARLMSKWTRQGWLSEMDLRRITCCLQNMRMLCDSTFLFDKETNFSPKLEEFREIIRELAIEEDRKVVVFSEYERMTYLAAKELDKMKIPWVSLHGGVPARARGKLMVRFREDPRCKVFLSTDAGGVGLNLQSGSAVVNFEPPWNPARLEQRIGRVHRLGQARPVQVIHLLTEGSIEERVWETMRLKKALFAGLFDSTTSEVSFEKLGRKSMMQVIKEVCENQPSETKRIPEMAANATAAAASSVPLGADPPRNGPIPSVKAQSPNGSETKQSGVPGPGSAPAARAGESLASRKAVDAARSFLQAGLELIASLSPADSPSSDSANRLPPVQAVQQAVAGCIRRNAQTQRAEFAIPLPESVTGEQIARAAGSLLEKIVSALGP